VEVTQRIVNTFPIIFNSTSSFDAISFSSCCRFDDIDYKLYILLKRLSNAWKASISLIASATASSNRWFIQFQMNSAGNCSFNLFPTPFFVPSITDAPSEVKAIRFLTRYSLSKEYLAKTWMMQLQIDCASRPASSQILYWILLLVRWDESKAETDWKPPLYNFTLIIIYSYFCSTLPTFLEQLLIK